MLVLGIESTCDETAVAVVRDGEQILSSVISSQIDLHSKFGGVVPELACRRHIDVCIPILREALQEAGVTLEEIDLISVAHGPGLIGALLIGVNFAQGLAFALNKPLVGVNHVEAHLYACMMEQKIALPALGVVLSGGHTALVKIEEVGKHTLIGQTQDDAIGEAFDKVASLLDLSYPGGPKVEALASGGDPGRYSFKAGRIKGRPYDFSFSGLKTAVLYTVKGQNRDKHAPLAIAENEKRDVAASFQHIAFSDIVSKSLAAAQEYECQSILLGGGVTSNRCLRSYFSQSTSLPVFWPPQGLSLDNAAMIAGLGYHIYRTSGANDPEPLPRISWDC